MERKENGIRRSIKPRKTINTTATNKNTPSFIIRKKLIRNKPVLYGLYAIFIAIFISLFSYILIPDNSPNANNGLIELKKLPPFSSVQVVKIKRKKLTERNFFTSVFTGFTKDYKLIPIDGYSANDKTIVVDIYRGLGKYKDSINVSNLYASNIEESVESKFFMFGTDQAGRDVFSRLLLGTRISLSIGFIAVIISLVVGITIGAMAGFFRGWVDQVLMWFTTVIWSIPGIMLVISISIALESSGVWVTFMAVGLTMWVEVARVVRGQIIDIRVKSFVEAAQTIGAGNFHIITRHILPNIIGPIIVIATSNFAASILIEAGLSFLGLGVQPPTPSWGLMVHEGFQLMGTKNSWHLILFPSLAISILVLAFNLLGNGLRDAFDPKST